MKKPVDLLPILLVAAMLVSCAGTAPSPGEDVPRPGVSIGAMRLEEHSTNGSFPALSDYCGNYLTTGKQPGSHKKECNVPLLPRLKIEFGWGARDTATLKANWEDMIWELYIDEQKVELDQFEPKDETWNEIWIEGAGNQDIPARSWYLDLVNLSPGKHTIRFLWKSEIAIDDGFDIYPPGTYEDIVNFTVPEE